MIIILAGTIGRSGLGGQAWAGLQYLLGLRALGHEVYYLEDCGGCSYVYHWESEAWTYELEYPAAFVDQCLRPFGLGDRWIYRNNEQSLGMPLDAFVDVCGRTDLLILRAVPLWDWREEYSRPGRRAFIDVDPGFTQISMANGDAGLVTGISRAEKRFTYGRRVGAHACTIPPDGGPWIPTVPPVFLAEWPIQVGPGGAFTSVMRWQGFREVTYQGSHYGQRDQEFPLYFELPHQSGATFCVAQMGLKPEVLQAHGWDVVPGEKVSKTPASYREFIRQSRAEFSIPKHGYVKMQGGWFSDRSVCYLASGRPVLIEDTGLSDWLPVGQGLVTFTNPAEALEGIREVNAHYESHQQAARRLAEEHFSTDRVLPGFLEAAMN